MPQIATFNTNVNLPDPRLQVIDFAGAFRSALDTYLKVRAMGMEERLKQQQMDIARQKLTLDVTKTFADLDREERRLTSDIRHTQAQDANDAMRTEFDRMRTMSDLAVKGSMLSESRLRLQEQLDEKGAQVENTTLTGAGFYDPFDKSVLGAEVTSDPIDRLGFVQNLQAWGNDPNKQRTLQSLTSRSPALAKSPEMLARLNPALKINQILNAPVHDAGVPAQIVEVEEGANVPAAIRAMSGQEYETMTDQQKALLAQFADSPQVKIRTVQGRNLMYSDKQLMDGIAAGKPELARIFLRDAKGPNKDAALQFIRENYGGSLSELMLQDVAPAGAEYDKFREIPPAVPASVAAMVNKATDGGSKKLIDRAVMLRPKINPDTGERIEGQYDSIPLSKADGSPMTIGDSIRESLQITAAKARWPKALRDAAEKEYLKFVKMEVDIETQPDEETERQEELQRQLGPIRMPYSPTSPPRAPETRSNFQIWLESMRQK